MILQSLSTTRLYMNRSYKSNYSTREHRGLSQRMLLALHFSHILFSFFFSTVLPKRNQKYAAQLQIYTALTPRVIARSVAAATPAAADKQVYTVHAACCIDHGRRWRRGQPILGVHVLAVMVDDEEPLEGGDAGPKTNVVDGGHVLVERRPPSVLVLHQRQVRSGPQGTSSQTSRPWQPLLALVHGAYF